MNAVIEDRLHCGIIEEGEITAVFQAFLWSPNNRMLPSYSHPFYLKPGIPADEGACFIKDPGFTHNHRKSVLKLI
jgi:hypothetical protein